MTISTSPPPTPNRRRWGSLAAAFALSLSALVAAPTAAQIGDAPPLGFTIDPTEGAVGDTVDGQVDVDDIAEHCITDPAEFVGQFVDPAAPLGGGTAYWDAIEAYAEANDPNEMGDAQQLAVLTGAFFPIGLAQDLTSPDSEGLAEQAMEGTFIMAFADLATQSPIAPYGNFDKNTGVGSTDVPNLPGGNQPVIATCVGLPDEIDVASVAVAVDAATAYIEANMDLEDPDFDLIEAVTEVAPVLIEALIEPKGLGIAFYCVDDGAGSCDEEEPTDPTEPTEPTEPSAPGGPSASGTAPGATPVSGRPAYTG